MIINLLRLGVFAGAGVLLPSFLTHRMPVAVFGAWTLILQIAGYITYLEFGIQIAVSKYVAQCRAAGDHEGCHRYSSAGVAITGATAGFGLLLSIALYFFVPRLFSNLGVEVTGDVARGVLLVGSSAALLLGSSAFGGIFLGLQRYALPTSIAIGSKLFYAALLVVMVMHHASLTAMGAGVALLNITTALAQVLAWRLLAYEVRISPRFLQWAVMKEVLGYCTVLGIWTAGLLIISGLDTAIVGRLDFPETAFYAIAATPLTFLSMTLQAGLNPLMPATSAMSVTRSPQQIGQTLLRCTRYGCLLLQVTGLPLLLFGYPVLDLWVGPVYAHHGLPFLRTLVLAHIVRNLCGPFATMVIAVGLQRYATWAGVWEALVNLSCSLLLGWRFGAIGVAAGTLIGAALGVALHFALSMRHTGHRLDISRKELLLGGILRPAAVALPTLLLLPWLWHAAQVPHLSACIAVWTVGTATLFWRAGLTLPEREALWAKAAPILRRRGVDALELTQDTTITATS